ECAVCPIVTNCIGEHVCLGLVLVGNTTAMSLVPIDDKLPGLAVVDYVFAHVVVLAFDIVQVRVSRRFKVPTSARQAVLRRVDRLSAALCCEVADEETD